MRKRPQPVNLQRKQAGLAAWWSVGLLLGVLAAAPARAETVSVTVTEGTNMAAAVAPDGKQIVIDLQGTLWILPAGGGASKALTDALMDARQPAWSPDGKLIVFQSFRDGGWHLWTVRPDGSALTQLTKGSADEREPQFSPDGKAIAFSSDRRGNYDIYVMPSAGGEARAVTTSPGNDYAPAWSPDGRELAFVSDRDKAGGLYLIAADGSRERLILGEGGIAAPSWRPDGQAILYVAQTKDTSHLRSVGTVGGTATDIAAGSEDVFPFRAAWLAPNRLLYTADGLLKQRTLDGAAPQTIAFNATFQLDRPAYQRRAIDFRNTAARPVQGIRAPQVSPNGQQIAFTALGDIWFEDIDAETLGRGKGPKAHRLAHDEALDLDPAWAPDGSQLAFVTDRSGKPEIWLRDLKTNKDRQLTTLPEDVMAPVWSPDSKRLAFYRVVSLDGLGTAQLAVANVFTGDVQNVHAPLWAPGRASWSPDGKTLAIAALAPASSRFREGLTKFLLISLTGAPDRWVSPVADRSLAMRGVNGPVWSPDGTKMAYIDEGRLWVMPVIASGPRVGEIDGAPRALTTELAEAPSWTADSASLVYLATDTLKRIDLDGKATTLQPHMTWTRNIPRGRTIVWAGRMWDGTSDAYRTNVDIVIDGNVIAAIEPHRDGRTDGALVNAARDTVIPGLVESHAHMSAAFGNRFGRLWLSFGITSVREPGIDPYEALERRESWASGARPGPREFYTGGLMDGARVYYGFANSVTSEAHLDLELGRAQTLGYDLIKTYVRMPDAFQKLVVGKAHAIGIPVSSHELYPAVGYGVDAVEHLRGTSRRGYSPKQSETAVSYGDVIALIAKSGMSITPTVALQGGFAMTALMDPALLSAPQFTALYREDERTAIAAGIERARPTLPALQHTVSAMQRAVKQIVQQGGRVTAGTDAAFVPYGLSLLVELQLYQQAGLTPIQVLRTATASPAAALGLADQLGTIEPGKLADLDIVSGDPLSRVADLVNVRGVVADGHYYLIDELLHGR